MPDESKLPTIPAAPQFFQFSAQHMSVSPEMWEQKLAELKSMPEFAEQAKLWEQVYAAMKQRLAEVRSEIPTPTIEAVVEKEPSIRDAFRAGRQEVEAMMERMARLPKKD